MNFKKAFLIGLSLVFIPSYVLAGNLDDGISLYKSGEYEKAIEKLNKAAKEEPDNPEPHLWLYKSYESLLQIENVFPEKKIYDNLKSKKLLKDKQEIEKKENEEQRRKDEENKFIEVEDEDKIVSLNSSYLPQIISKRNSLDEMKNLKYLDIKTLKDLLNSIVTDSESLHKLFKETQIKTHYGIATPTEFILMNKSKLELISYDIDLKKLEISQEKDPDNKKIKQSEMKNLIKDYKYYFELAEKSINEPIYVDADPTSYEYFIASESPADSFIQILEDKKNIFKPLIDSMIVDIANLKKSVQSQEKNIIIKKEGLEPELLDVDIRTLEGDKKEKISLYQNLRDKLNGDKIRLKTLTIESDILINFYNRMNETIKKIKPDYVIKNIKLK